MLKKILFNFKLHLIIMLKNKQKPAQMDVLIMVYVILLMEFANVIIVILDQIVVYLNMPLAQIIVIIKGYVKLMVLVNVTMDLWEKVAYHVQIL